MARQNLTIPLPGFPGQLYFQQTIASGSSPKVNGKLKLQANALVDSTSQVTYWSPLSPDYTDAGANVSTTFPFTTAQYNELYAQWVGKLRHGSASMGVTLGSWTQSRSMIVDRSRKLLRFLGTVQANVRRKPWLYRKRDLASDFLEGEFGWLPLVSDIHAAVTTVCGDAIPPQWARASRTYTMNETTEQRNAGMVSNRRTLSGNARMTIACGVEIANPNLWLANRLGIINPATVAWDLVPWSFVVNMFLNVNQVVGALTDTVGLTLTNGSVTRSSRILREERSWITVNHTVGGRQYTRGQSYGINVNTKSRTRTTGAPPMPSLSFRLPNVNFELAAIATALVAQRARSI
jgi:hypothetical protein